MPPKKKPKKPKPKQKQKQKQKQSQKVVVNIGSQRKRQKRPRATARPNTAKVLSQFFQPQPLISPQALFPVQYPAPLTPSTPFLPPSPSMNNSVLSPSAKVSQAQITGRATNAPPRITERVRSRIITDDEVRKARRAIADANTLMSENPLTSFTPTAPPSQASSSQVSNEDDEFDEGFLTPMPTGFTNLPTSEPRTAQPVSSTPFPMAGRSLFSKTA